MAPPYRVDTEDFVEFGRMLLSKFEPEPFLQAMQDFKVSVGFLVPPIILFLAAHPAVEQFDLSSLEESDIPLNLHNGTDGFLNLPWFAQLEGSIPAQRNKEMEMHCRAAVAAAAAAITSGQKVSADNMALRLARMVSGRE